MFHNNRNVDKKFQLSIFYWNRENHVYPKKFQTDMSNYIVAFLYDWYMIHLSRASIKTRQKFDSAGKNT